MEGGFRGLFIVFSPFMIQILAFGNYPSVGIYTVHLLDVFDNYVVCAPLASFLMTTVSYRKLCLLGASPITICHFCTPLLTYLPAMYILFGVFAGLLSQLHGGYDQSFYSAGVLSMFAGLIMVFVYLPKCLNNKQKA